MSRSRRGPVFHAAVDQTVRARVRRPRSPAKWTPDRDKIEPTVKAAAARIRRSVLLINAAIGVVVAAGIGVMIWLRLH